MRGALQLTANIHYSVASKQSPACALAAGSPFWRAFVAGPFGPRRCERGRGRAFRNPASGRPMPFTGASARPQWRAARSLGTASRPAGHSGRNDRSRAVAAALRRAGRALGGRHDAVGRRSGSWMSSQAVRSVPAAAHRGAVSDVSSMVRSDGETDLFEPSERAGYNGQLQQRSARTPVKTGRNQTSTRSVENNLIKN